MDKNWLKKLRKNLDGVNILQCIDKNLKLLGLQQDVGLSLKKTICHLHFRLDHELEDLLCCCHSF